MGVRMGVRGGGVCIPCIHPVVTLLQMCLQGVPPGVLAVWPGSGEPMMFLQCRVMTYGF